ncbi:hypothetical protein OSB04_015981 [Centaurea solstitialis]|uniref:F-box domain-containing protein n=1 Tax=Centaurea solstitialis TaxID=347529 RepID=A0AA38TB57_9ASTR|nr:hypothetical protein OSB04_015981 [Centaurea solstitialis]
MNVFQSDVVVLDIKWTSCTSRGYFLARIMYLFTLFARKLPSINPSMENLPEQVMVDILSRLPVKTIIHCKCVCKKWHNLVNDSYFINLHLSRSPAGFMAPHDPHISGGATLKMGRIMKWVEIEDELDHHSLQPALNFDVNGFLGAPFPPTVLIPLGSVNGLICILHRGVNVNVDHIYICNPITREFLALPRQQNYKDADLIYKFGVNSLSAVPGGGRAGHTPWAQKYWGPKITYLYSRGPFIYISPRAQKMSGTGLNSLTGEYKLLGILQMGPPARQSPLQVIVYTLGTSQWRSLGQAPEWIGGLDGPLLNGCFHLNVKGQGFPESIFTFDLDKETFQLFPSPPTQAGAMRECTESLAVFKGCLCKSYSCTSDSQITIWVMKQYGIKESWHKELLIAHSICPGVDGVDWLLMRYIVYVFGVLRDGTILVVLGSKVLAYYPQSKTFERIEFSLGRFILLNHRPSFIKLKDIDSERVHTF